MLSLLRDVFSGWPVRPIRQPIKYFGKLCTGYWRRVKRAKSRDEALYLDSLVSTAALLLIAQN